MQFSYATPPPPKKKKKEKRKKERKKKVVYWRGSITDWQGIKWVLTVLNYGSASCHYEVAVEYSLTSY